MITIKEGSLLEATEDVICHQVNCKGVMGAGVAKQIKDKWPEVFEKYIKKIQHFQNGEYSILGNISIAWVLVPYKRHQIIINMYAQDGYGREGRYTNYEAFYSCLEEIKRQLNYAKTDNTLPLSVAFPYKIGCGLGGGNWKIIYTMIEEVLKDYEVVIYKLPGEED